MAVDISVSVPRSWDELSVKQLKYVFSLLNMGFSMDEVKTYCFFRWSGIELLGRNGADYIMKKNGVSFVASPLLVQSATEKLDYLASFPLQPVHLPVIHKCKAVDVRFEGVQFKKFLMCDNLYQGYLHTKNEELLDSMASILYHGDTLKLDGAERISVFYWWAALKNLLCREFQNFLQPSGNSDHLPDIGKMVKRAMNAQIRALTKGDITKEKEVLEMDTWRALTELDALALEYQELKRKYK